MHYLHVIDSMDPRSGGPCQGVRNLVPRFLELGHTVEVVCLDDPAADYLADEPITVHALGKGRLGWGYHPALRPWLEANRARFDAVILNGLWSYPGFILCRLSRRPHRPPYFVFPHGMLDPWFQRAPERRLKAVRNWFYWKIIEQHVIGQAQAVLFTCAEETRLARETFFPYQPKGEINVGFGISPPPESTEQMAGAFAQKCPGLNGRPYYLFLSRIHPKKGLDLLIKAYAAVYYTQSEANIQKTEPSGRSHARSPHATIQPIPCLVIAGPGCETAYGRHIQNLARQLLPPTAFFFAGMLTGDAKWGSLYGAMSFVLPSHQENFGIAVVEALACGTPVLISKQVNIWREITEAGAGLAEPDTSTGVETLLRSWRTLSNGQAVAKIKQAARNCYETRFCNAPAAERLLEIVSDLKATVQVPH